ncbi:MAG: hypothetical protein N2651_10355 [Fimbriimonadales bacterium]|nr:hypothetical protein [Fimbriimonadales bacterium]
MRGWLIGLGLILLLNLIAVGYWHYDDGLQESFENLDTRVILQRLQQPNSAWKWFVGDWVLGNGFYRPLPSVLYQLDYRLWGENLLAWKWTNGALTTLNALLVVAFGWALSGRRDLALAGGLIFTFWQTGLLPEPPFWLSWIGLAVGILWGWRVGNLRQGMLWGCVAFALIVELRFIPTLPDIHMQGFAYRAVGWIPGRTATLMTLCALIALTGTCLYARTGKVRWAVTGLLGFVGALMSYEQAVVLPILMGLAGWVAARPRFPALSLTAWDRGVRSDADVLTPIALFAQGDAGGETHALTPDPSPAARERGADSPSPTAWERGQGGEGKHRFLLLPLLCVLFLLPYLAFYRANIPTQTQYHQQRLKRFRIMPETTLYWLIPTGREAITQMDVARTAPFNLLMPPFWMGLLGLAAYLGALRVGLRAGWLGWLGALLAYAPAMPVLPLTHYYYLPTAFRALWAGILLLCLLTLRPTRRVTSVALVDAMCLKRSSLRSTS